MALVIQTNVASLQAQKNLNHAQSSLQTSFNRLSSGNRINTAKDDAAGLAISESMKTQVRSFAVAERNAGDAVSMAQTAEGALGEITNIVGRMRELSAQASNGALQTSDRAFIQTEFTNLQKETKRIMTSTKFNGKTLITSASRVDGFQVGINNTSADRISITFGGINLSLVTSTTTNVSGSASNARSSPKRMNGNALTCPTGSADCGWIYSCRSTPQHCRNEVSPSAVWPTSLCPKAFRTPLSSSGRVLILP